MFSVFLIFVMKIHSNLNSISFGTQIRVRDRVEHIKYTNNKFSKHVLEALTVPMCDFWTVIDEKKLAEVYRDKSMYKPTKLPLGKYHVTKNSCCSTGGIDICTAGVVLGKDGRVGMFHIAPTIENLDLLLDKSYKNRTLLGKSIDEFSQKAGGIKKAIIVGGKKPLEQREEFSQKVNKLIRNQFEERGVEMTILSDFKQYLCDIFYRSGDDVLEIGVMNTPSKNNIDTIFGEVVLQADDTIKFL